jgi:hypothetical protein
LRCPFRESFTCEDPDSQTCIICPNVKLFLKAALAAEQARDLEAELVVMDEESIKEEVGLSRNWLRVDGHTKEDE